MVSMMMLLLSSQLSFIKHPKHNLQLHSSSSSSSSSICCGLRKANRKPTWRSSGVLSTEAIHAVQSLKLAAAAKSPHKLQLVFDATITRLLKTDLLDTLAELKRQNQLDLALQVFDFLRKEVLHEPDHLSLYSDMILMLGRNKLIHKAEELFSELEKQGLKPDTRAYTELIGAYLQVDMLQKAMETYKSMKESGCTPDKLTLIILIRNLETAGEAQLAAQVKEDCYKYLDSPKQFLQEAQRTFPKRRSLDLI